MTSLPNFNQYCSIQPAKYENTPPQFMQLNMNYIKILYRLPQFTFSSLQQCCFKNNSIKIFSKVTNMWEGYTGEKLSNAQEKVTTTTKPHILPLTMEEYWDYINFQSTTKIQVNLRVEPQPQPKKENYILTTLVGVSVPWLSGWKIKNQRHNFTLRVLIHHTASQQLLLCSPLPSKHSCFLC